MPRFQRQRHRGADTAITSAAAFAASSGDAGACHARRRSQDAPPRSYAVTFEESVVDAGEMQRQAL